MSINFNHVTNDITASSGSVSINGSVPSGGGGASAITISNKTAAYTIVAGDLGTIINCTSGTFTVSLTAAATLGSGFNCWIWNNSTTATDVITIDPSGAETIDGVATLILRRGEGMQIVCDGTNFQTGDKKTMRVYAENIASTATRPTASGANSLVIGNGVSSGATAYAIGFGTPTAGAQNSFALGMNSSNGGSVTATGLGAMALGGSYASGTDSFAAAGTNNTSTYGAKGANSVAIGYLNIVSSSNAIGIGTNLNPAAAGAVAIGGDSIYGALAYGVQSFVHGFGSRSDYYGQWVYASGRFANAGDAQTSMRVLRRATTNATATVLTADANAPGSTNQLIVPNNSAFAFSILIVGRQQAAGGTASAAWKIEGLIRREANAASTTLVNSATTVLDNAPGWAVAVSADTTNGGLAVTVTGAAATNIRWVATIDSSEVTYA